MIRAFFNVRLDDALLPDRIGQSVADAEAARGVARRIIRSLVLQHGGEPRLLDAAMVVSDEAGATLLEMTFFEALYLPVEPVAPTDADRRRDARAASVPLLSEARLGAALRPVRRFADAMSARMQPLIGG